MTMANVKTKKVTTLYFVLLGLFVAMAFVVTYLLPIPIGIGYLNVGDAVVMIAGIVLGPVGGAVTGLIGPAIADAVLAPIYIPFTAIIKCIEGWMIGAMFIGLPLKNSFARSILACIAASVWVTIGYAVADFMLVCFGWQGFSDYSVKGAFLAGAITMPWTLLQMGASTAIAMLCAPKLPQLVRNKLFFPERQIESTPEETTAEKTDRIEQDKSDGDK